MQRRWSRIFALTMGIPLLLAILAACGSGTTSSGSSGSGSAPAGSTVIKVATDLPVSGKDESGGKPTENGAHLAVDEANAAHTIPGYTLTFVPKDDVGPSGSHDGATGQKNVQDLIGDALVAGIVGPLNSSVAVAELPVANQAPIAIISPANTNDCLTQTTPDYECGGSNNKIPTYRPSGKVTYFRIATMDQFQGSALADYGTKEKGYKKVYVVDDTETYGVGIATQFIAEWKKDGGTVLGRTSEAPTTTSYVSLLTQIAAMSPDVIFFGGNDSTGGIPLRQQMLQVPALANTPMLAGDGTQTSAFARTIGHKGGPVYTSIAGVDISKIDAAKDFIAKYSATYGANNIGSYSGPAYDSMKILIGAIKTAMANGAKTPANSADTTQAKVFRQAVIDAIQKTDYTGVTGHHSFDQNGDTTNRAISIYDIAPDVNKGDGWEVLTIVKVGS